MTHKHGAKTGPSPPISRFLGGFRPSRLVFFFPLPVLPTTSFTSYLQNIIYRPPHARHEKPDNAFQKTIFFTSFPLEIRKCLRLTPIKQNANFDKEERETRARKRGLGPNGLEAKHRKRSCEGGGGNRRRRIITTGGQRNRRESCEGVISRPCAVSPVTAEAMCIQTGTLSAAKNGRWCKKSRSLRAVVWGCQGAVDELALVIVSAGTAPHLLRDREGELKITLRDLFLFSYLTLFCLYAYLHRYHYHHFLFMSIFIIIIITIFFFLCDDGTRYGSIRQTFE